MRGVAAARAGWGTFSALALAGMGIASYLTYLHWSEAPAYCAVASGCETVNRSGYSTLGPAPVALLGALLYAAWIGLGLAGLAGRRGVAALALGSTLFGLAFACYLTYAEVAVLRAICIWCVASLVVIAALFAIAAGQAWLQRRRWGVGTVAAGLGRGA